VCEDRSTANIRTLCGRKAGECGIMELCVIDFEFLTVNHRSGTKQFFGEMRSEDDFDYLMAKFFQQLRKNLVIVVTEWKEVLLYERQVE